MTTSTSDQPRTTPEPAPAGARRPTGPTFWNGVQYPSLIAVARAASESSGVPAKTIRGRLRSLDWSLSRAATQPPRVRRAGGTTRAIPTLWDGVQYPSLTAAARAASARNGIPLGAIYGRVNLLGWPFDRAASEPVHTPEVGMVYLIRHRASGRAYVGKTKIDGLQERMAQHMLRAAQGKGGSGSLHEALRLEGLDAFEVVVLEDRASDAIAAEKAFILAHQARTHGFNQSAGGERGSRPRRIKFKGRWFTGAVGLIQETLGEAAVALKHRFYKAIRLSGGWSGLTDARLESALQQVSQPVRPEGVGAPHIWNGAQYPSLTAAARAASAVSGIPFGGILGRVRLGWAFDRAASEPVRAPEKAVLCMIQHRASRQTYIGRTWIEDGQKQDPLRLCSAMQAGREAHSLTQVLRREGPGAFDARLRVNKRWFSGPLDAMSEQIGEAARTAQHRFHSALMRKGGWAGALLRDGTLLHLRTSPDTDLSVELSRALMAVPLLTPRAFTESDLLAMRIVVKFLVPRGEQLPLRTILALMVARRARARDKLALDADLRVFGVAWSPTRKRYFRGEAWSTPEIAKPQKHEAVEPVEFFVPAMPMPEPPAVVVRGLRRAKAAEAAIWAYWRELGAVPAG